VRRGFSQKIRKKETDRAIFYGYASKATRFHGHWASYPSELFF